MQLRSNFFETLKFASKKLKKKNSYNIIYFGTMRIGADEVMKKEFVDKNDVTKVIYIQQKHKENILSYYDRVIIKNENNNNNNENEKYSNNAEKKRKRLEFN